jgi:hypothetical protein
MIFQPYLFLLFVIQLVLPEQKVSNKVIQKKDNPIEIFDNQIIQRYNALSNRERLNLLFYSQNEQDSAAFLINSKNPSTFSKYIPYINSEKKHLIFSEYLNSENKGNLLFSKVLSATSPLDIDFYSDNPVERASWCDSLIQENLKKGSVIVYSGINKLPRSKGWSDQSFVE